VEAGLEAATVAEAGLEAAATVVEAGLEAAATVVEAGLQPCCVCSAGLQACRKETST
jgi:hypothetical protein